MTNREFPIRIGDTETPLILVFQYEKELSELKPEIYDAMFPISYLDFDRVFPAIFVDGRLFYLIEREDAEVTK